MNLKNIPIWAVLVSVAVARVALFAPSTTWTDKTDVILLANGDHVWKPHRVTSP